MKKKSLVWVYPTNNWTADNLKTFIYGYCNPKARLFVQVGTCRGKAFKWNDLEKVKVSKSGNYAQVVKLIKKSNKVRLVQELNGKKKTITRNVLYKRPKVETHSHASLQKEGKPRKPLSSPIIVIDPGHGGKEDGTHCPSGIPESTYNLEIGMALYKKLKQKNPNVYLTRRSNKFISLKDRVAFAKKKNSNILISIHHNALPDGENPLKHKGIGIYYTHKHSLPLGKKLLNSISKEANLKKYGIFKRNFALTKPDFCQAILIECGFLIHPEEAEYITKKSTQKKIVKGILKTILSSPT